MVVYCVSKLMSDLNLVLCNFLSAMLACNIYVWYIILYPRSKDEEIDLVAEKEFFKEAPTEISKPVCSVPTF